jgi:probable phosphoglycerate mutase
MMDERSQSPVTSEHADLLLVRHCQTEWNERRWYQGRSDPPLCAVGIRAAELLAHELQRVLVCRPRIITSPLARARMTAAVLAGTINAPLHFDDRLTELSYGAWEGRTQSAIRAIWPEILRQWKRAPETVCLPGGECLEQLRHRVKAFLDEQLAGSGQVLAVTHDGVMRIAILEALKLPLAAFRTVKTTHSALAHLARGASGLTLTSAVRVRIEASVPREQNLPYGRYV